MKKQRRPRRCCRRAKQHRTRAARADSVYHVTFFSSAPGKTHARHPRWTRTASRPTQTNEKERTSRASSRNKAAGGKSGCDAFLALSPQAELALFRSSCFTSWKQASPSRSPRSLATARGFIPYSALRAHHDCSSLVVHIHLATSRLKVGGISPLKLHRVSFGRCHWCYYASCNPHIDTKLCLAELERRVL